MTPDDIDPVAVERATQGDRTVHLTHAEMGAAWQQLEARGLSARVIGERLGVTERSIVRWRSTGFPVRTRLWRDAS